MYNNILLLLINIIFIYYSSLKIKKNNDYEKEKRIFYNKKIKLILTIINISNIIINSSFFIIAYQYKYIDIIDFIIFIVTILSYIILELTHKNKRIRLKLFDKKLINNLDKIIILSAATIAFSQRFESKLNQNIIF